VDIAELHERGGNESAGEFWVGDVARIGDGAAAVLAQRTRRSLCLLGIKIVDDDARAFRRQPPYQAQTDAATRAGDQRHFSG
jgi:hypothetical protein